MNVVVLYNDPAQVLAASGTSATSDLDVFVQRDAIVAALESLGHDVRSMACTADLQSATRQLSELQPTIVFNLVESLLGTDRMMPAAALLLESLELAFTGSGTDALLQSGNKLAAKRRLAAHGMPTPVWVEMHSSAAELTSWDAALAAAQTDTAAHGRNGTPPPRMIVKANWEHASSGMLDTDVTDWLPSGDTLAMLLRRHQTGRPPALAERFVEGREFNLSLLAKSSVEKKSGQLRTDFARAVEVLPPAEILFENYPQDKPRIVGYAAKWDEQSFEYQQTPRRFDFESSDEALLQQLRDLAVEAWYLFDMQGYARVDFRVDGRGRPWILEINANPCLSPDAGFAAALQRAGISFATAIERILIDAMAT